MRQHSQRGRSRAALYAMIGAVLIAIAAVFLLANGQRNLRRIFGEEVRLPQLIQKQEAPAPRRNMKTRRIDVPPFYLPARYLSEDDFSAYSSFIRLIGVRGDPFCAFLNEIGLQNEGWRQSALASRDYECPAQLRVPPDAETADSLFADIRGREDGEMTRIRLKLYLPLGDSRMMLAAKAAEILQFLAKASDWSDVGDLTQKIAEGKAFSVASYGLRIRFAPETLNDNGFNIFFLPALETAAARNAHSYFQPASPRLPHLGRTDAVLERVYKDLMQFAVISDR